MDNTTVAESPCESSSSPCTKEEIVYSTEYFYDVVCLGEVSTT